MMRQLAAGLINLLYPPLCLHCCQSIESPPAIFCRECTALLELIDASERCPLCFSADYEVESRLCYECRRHPPVLDGIASVFDYLGPAATLVRKMKYGDRPYLAKGGGAWMAAQFLQIGWEMPDVIIPVPISFVRWLERGFNQSALLAESMSGILSVPMEEALQRKTGEYSQAGLNRKQRIALEGRTIVLKPGKTIRDKTVLLVDDVMTTGSTMRRCAEALLEGAPARIYGMSFCRAVR